MAGIIFILCLILMKTSSAYECCKDDYCSPPQVKPRPTEFIDDFSMIPDPDGCFCGEYDKKYVECCNKDSCFRIPTNMNFTLLELRILTAAIKSINRTDLDNYAIIETLVIENNADLEYIEEYAFSQLNNLLNLSISHNHKLTYLEPKTFEGLINLRELHLLNNGFKSITDFSEALSPIYLPKLYDLILKENYFKVIGNEDFAPMANSTLRRLNLVNCRIDDIHSSSLVHLINLEELRIGGNIFDVDDLTELLQRTTAAGINLKFLNLYKIGLRKTPPEQLLEAIGNSTIECLSLAGNHFETITKESFPIMKDLKLLDMRDVSAIDVTADAFDNLKGLKTLLLANNKLSTIPEGVRIPDLVFLDMNMNARGVATTSYFTVDKYAFTNMTNLYVLNLSFNKVDTLNNATFFGLKNLKILSLKKAVLSYIGPKAFVPLESLIFLDLESNEFKIAETTNLFEGLSNLNVLLLGDNHITHLPESTFLSLTSLTHLGLNDNGLIQLDATYFKFLPTLDTLDLKDNQLVPWKERVFSNQNNLTNIYLSNNKFTSLSPSVLDDIVNVTYLDFTKNNFICNCSLLFKFMHWVNKVPHHNKIFGVLQKSNATCLSDEELIIDYLKSSETHELCRQSYIPIIAPLAVLTILIFIIMILAYYYRWHLRYYWFLTKLHLIRKGKIKLGGQKKHNSNYEYDAFVSYSNEDSDFVVRLVSMMEDEEPFLKLCVYERDFEIGSIISESILKNVTKSRKVLLIVSDNYIKSNWCQWESHIAEYCRLYVKEEASEAVDDSLILVKLGLINQKNLTPTLKYLLKTRIYLQWEETANKQHQFWSKLRQNLSRGKNNSYTHV